MVKANLSECLALLNEHISINTEILNDYSRIDYHLKYISLIYKKTKYNTQKMLCELIGITERMLDQLGVETFKEDKE